MQENQAQVQAQTVAQLIDFFLTFSCFLFIFLAYKQKWPSVLR